MPLNGNTSDALKITMKQSTLQYFLQKQEVTRSQLQSYTCSKLDSFIFDNTDKCESVKKGCREYEFCFGECKQTGIIGGF